MTDPYKVVLVGESGVGKTCIIAQFTSGKFDPSTVSSLTAQFIRKTLEFPEGKSLTFDIWDTAGQEKYRSLAKIFYKDAKAVILVYDVTNEKSFTEMKDYWYEQIKQLGDKDIILAIAANKSDLYKNKYQMKQEKNSRIKLELFLPQLLPKMTVVFKPCLITLVKKYLIQISTSPLLKRKRKMNIKRKNNKMKKKTNLRLIKELK